MNLHVVTDNTYDLLESIVEKHGISVIVLDSNQLNLSMGFIVEKAA